MNGTSKSLKLQNFCIIFAVFFTSTNGIYGHESNPPIYRALLSPVLSFKIFPKYHIWYEPIFQLQIWKSSIWKNLKSEKLNPRCFLLEI